MADYVTNFLTSNANNAVAVVFQTNRRIRKKVPMRKKTMTKRRRLTLRLTPTMPRRRQGKGEGCRRACSGERKSVDRKEG